MVEAVWPYLLCCGVGFHVCGIQYTFGYAASFAPRGERSSTVPTRGAPVGSVLTVILIGGDDISVVWRLATAVSGRRIHS